MDWVKKNWIVLVCGLVAVAGVGIGVWSMMGFKPVQAEVDSIASIVGRLEGVKTGAANEAMIADATKWYAKNNKGTDDALEKAKAINKRTALRDDVFPIEKADDSGYRFRDTYKAATQKLPEIIHGGKAPSGAVVDLIVTRMEDKYRKEANLTSAGGELHVPKPPQVQAWAPTTPAAAVARPSMGVTRGDDRGDRMSGEEDPNRRSGGGEEAPRRLFTQTVRPGLQPSQPAVAIPTAEQLRPEARRMAVYQVAKSIWTYLNDDSFEMHPLGLPASVNRPLPEDLWAAQMFYWIEQDIAQALRRVNEQAAQALPEDQRWVAQLPIKHLVSLRISDYLAQGASDVSGRATGTTVLHRSGQSGVSNTDLGRQSSSFTDRTRTGEYDVVHIALNLVVDARDLPKVLAELCKQNFITPITVQYRNVNVVAAKEAGYLYGSGPILNVDIACEALFFRSIYEPMMPQAVKDALDGKVTAGQAADMMR